MIARFAPAAVRVALAAIALAILVVVPGLSLASGPDGRVRGYVTDYASGAPIPGASVRVETSDFPWRFEATTDPAGYFDIAVPPHRYTVQATSPAHYLGAAAAAVGSGMSVWANVSLVPAAARSARLRGYVTDAVSSAPVTTGRVLAELGSTYRNSTSLNASGYYAMDLLPGSYDVQTNGTDGYDRYDYYPVTVSAGNPLWYNFTLTPTGGIAYINGTVFDAVSYAPIAGARIAARVGTLYLPSVTSNGTGAYSLQSPRGNVEVSGDAPGHAPISTTTYVGGPGTSYVDLYLPPLSSGVHGYVLDGVTGRGLPGIPVTVDPIFSGGYSDRAITDASGWYDISLPNDDYILRASASGYTAGFAYVFFWSSQTVEVNVTLWPIVSTVAGHLIDGLTGAPVPGLNMMVIDSRSGYVVSGPADGTGSFSFPAPPSPAISVVVYGAGVYAGDIAYVGTRPSRTTWVNFTLNRLDAQITATVTDIATGLPVSGASVSVSWLYGFSGATSNGTGIAVLDAPAGLTLYLYTFAIGYLTWSDTTTLAPGSNAISIRLYRDLPQDVRVQGYLRDNGTGAGLWPGQVTVSGYDGATSTAYVGGTGYYSLSIVAAPQTIRGTSRGYAAGEVSVNPSPGQTLWLNFSLIPDAAPPVIRSFTANPPDRVSETNPTALRGTVNETSLEAGDLSILMLQSAAAGVGTFLNLGRLDPAGVTLTQPAPGSYNVSGSWDTRTPVGRLSDGPRSAWWPAIQLATPFQAFVNGYWDNATLSTPVPGSAVFDTRTGNLLFVLTLSGWFGPNDQPASTFQPIASGLRVDLATAGIVGASLVTGPTFTLGSLRMDLAPVVPSGQYGALLEAWDSAGSYDSAVVLFRTGPDSVPPVANAGPDRVVDEDTPVTLDGTASTDNVGIASYTWTFTDGGPVTLSGATATYTFATPGTYTITLTVRDADGNVGTDTLVLTVRDRTNPAVSITAPVEGASVPGSVLVSADATDNVGVVRVEFRLDGISVGNDTSAPFEVTVPSGRLSAGNHTFTVIAYDLAGNSAASTRNVTVPTTPPGGGGPTPGGPVVLLFGGLALIVIAAVAISLILLRRRRPRRPAGVPSPSAVPPSPMEGTRT
jgi:hypothetical protein